MDNIDKEISAHLKSKLSKKKINSYRKGSNFERLIAKILSKRLGIEIIRVPQSGAFSSTHQTNYAGGDLLCADKEKFFPFLFELKHQNKTNLLLDVLNLKKRKKEIFEWIDQAERDGKRIGKIPIIIFRLNRSPIFLIIKIAYISKFKNTNLFLKNKFSKIYFYFKNDLYLITELENFDIEKFYLSLKNGLV